MAPEDAAAALRDALHLRRRGAPMKRRFSIMVREFGADHEVELCQCDTNPNPIAYALEQKRNLYGKEYSSVRIVDNGEPAP
jgi:hypothetical protein